MRADFVERSRNTVAICLVRSMNRQTRTRPSGSGSARALFRVPSFAKTTLLGHRQLQCPLDELPQRHALKGCDRLRLTVEVLVDLVVDPRHGSNLERACLSAYIAKST